MRCRKEVHYECRLFKFLIWMHDQKDGLADKPNLEHFVVYARFDGIGLLIVMSIVYTTAI